MVVIRVGADPKPHDQISVLASHCAIILVDANRPDIREERFELERHVESVLLPDAIFLPCELLNLRWQRVEAGPKVGIGLGNHGRSERSPRAMSASTLARSLSS